MSKSADAFRTITEVAELLDTPAHVIRFWETRFPQIRPVKRAGGRRYFRPADVALIGGIKVLLHGEGMSIRDVQKLLKEQGVSHVMSLADMGKLFAEDEDTAPSSPVAKRPLDRSPSPEAPPVNPPSTIILPLKPRRPVGPVREQPSLFDIVKPDSTTAQGPASAPDGPAPEAPMAVDIPHEPPKPAQVVALAPSAPTPRTASKGRSLASALGRIDPAGLTPYDRLRLVTAQRRLIALHEQMRAPLPLLG